MAPAPSFLAPPFPGPAVPPDFWATWCGPCRQIAPMIEELASENEGSLKIGKVDVDQNQQVAMKYQIESIATLIVFKNGEPGSG